MHIELINYRFNKILEFSEKQKFSISQILGYIANLILVEDYYQLDKIQGKEKIDSFL